MRDLPFLLSQVVTQREREFLDVMNAKEQEKKEQEQETEERKRISKEKKKEKEIAKKGKDHSQKLPPKCDFFFF